MSKDVVLTDVNDEQILPITHARNVYINDSLTLEDYIKANGVVGVSHETVQANNVLKPYEKVEGN